MILVQRDLITMLHGILLVALLRFDGVKHERQILLSYRESKQSDCKTKKWDNTDEDGNKWIQLSKPITWDALMQRHLSQVARKWVSRTVCLSTISNLFVVKINIFLALKYHGLLSLNWECFEILFKSTKKILDFYCHIFCLNYFTKGFCNNGFSLFWNRYQCFHQQSYAIFAIDKFPFYYLFKFISASKAIKIEL